MSIDPATLVSAGSLTALRQKAASQPQDEATLRQVARQFEALLTQQVLKSARAASLGDEPVSGAGIDLYKDMFDQQMAQQMASGKGLGLADVLVRQLKMSAGGSDAVTSAQAAALSPSPSPTKVGEGGVIAPLSRISGRGAGGEGMAAAANPAEQVPASREQSFINRIWSVAETAAKALGISTETVVGHAALETGWGEHQPGGDSANFFGIKASSGWQGGKVSAATTEVYRGKAVKEQAAFRQYDSLQAGFADYVQFLKGNPRYAEALKAGASPQQFAQGLQKAGYATDPHYAEKLTAAVARVAKSRGAASSAF